MFTAERLRKRSTSLRASGCSRLAGLTNPRAGDRLRAGRPRPRLRRGGGVAGAAADDGVGDADGAHRGADVVHTDDVRAVRDAERGHRCRRFFALVRREAGDAADEVLARCRNEQRQSERSELAETPQDFPDLCDGEPAEVAARYAERIEPLGDARGSAKYRRRVIAAEVRRAVEAVT